MKSRICECDLVAASVAFRASGLQALHSQGQLGFQRVSGSRVLRVSGAVARETTASYFRGKVVLVHALALEISLLA